MLVLLVLSAVLFGCYAENAVKKEQPLDIGGPDYKPGDVMPSTDLSDINEAIEDVLQAGGWFESRRCAIALANSGDKVISAAKWYLEAGEIHTALPPSVESDQTGLALMTRDFWSLDGTNGVITYQIAGTEFQIAVMWAVPWYTWIYETKFNMKVYPKDLTPDKDMFDQMYYLAGSYIPGGWETREEFGIALTGSITNGDDAKLIVYVDSTNYDFGQGPSYHAWCEFYWVGSWCRRECSPYGQCWTDITCKNDEDCNGDMQCSESCTD